MILLGIVLKIVLRKSLVCSCNRDNLSPLLLIMPHLLKGLSCLTGGNKSCLHPYEITGNHLLTDFLCICSHFQVKNFFMCAEIYKFSPNPKGPPWPVCRVLFLCNSPISGPLPWKCQSSHLASLNSDVCSFQSHCQPSAPSLCFGLQTAFSLQAGAIVGLTLFPFSH